MDTAHVCESKLSDGSTVWHVLQHVDGNALTFCCVDAAHAEKLAALLDDCVDINISV